MVSDKSPEEQVKERTKLKSMEDEESKKIAVDINVMDRKAALDHCDRLGFTLANTPGVKGITPRALGMKGVEVDFDAIEIGQSRSAVKPKQNRRRIDLGNAPKESKAEYVPTGQGDEDDSMDVEEFIQLDVGEGQDFESLNYNHKLRRKLRRAIDNAEIRKEMLVRQRAIDYYYEKAVEVPDVLKTPCKPINVKGQRILDNGRFETAKQERVRARLDLAEFNAQMRILRKQAKDAAIYAGLRKHAELTRRITSSEPSVKPNEAGQWAQIGHLGMTSALEDSLTAVASRHTDKLLKRSRIESPNSSSGNSETGSEKAREVSSLSFAGSDNSSSASADQHPVKKRQKVESSNGNKQSESTNSDRQAMIDAETARSNNQAHGKLLSGSGYLKEVGVSASHEFRKGGLGKGANSIPTWKVPGDPTRKGKFLRLLGTGRKSSMATDGELDNEGRLADHSALINAVLERQYEDGMVYNRERKRKGLGL